MINCPVDVGDEFTYLGVKMVCLTTSFMTYGEDFPMIHAHYFNSNNELKECDLNTSVWKYIKKVK
jgi:hypothetical protein